MIKVNKINGSPESIPNTSFGLYSDAEFFYFFESDSERENYLQSLNVFSLEAWKAEANQLHNELFASLYIKRDYLSIGDVALFITDEEFSEEAISLREWWKVTWKQIDAVTEQEAQQITPADFINSLPAFQP